MVSLSIRIEADITHPAPKTLRQEIEREALSNPIRIESPYSQGIPASPKRPSQREDLGFSQEKIWELVSSLPNLTEEDRLLLALRMEKRIGEVANDFQVAENAIHYRLRKIKKKVNSEFKENISPEIQALVFADHRKFNPGRPKKNTGENKRGGLDVKTIVIPDFLAKENSKQVEETSENGSSLKIERETLASENERQKYDKFLPNEEEMMVHQAQEGDQEAVTHLYQSYSPRLYRYFLGKTGSPQDAEDLNHEVFLKISQNLATFKFRGAPFSAWIFRIARNTIISFSRKQKVREHVSLEDNRQSQSQFLSPEQFVEDRLLWTQVLLATDKISDLQRAIIHFRFVWGLSVAETAKKVGKSAANVKVIQHKAIAKLKTILANDGFKDIVRMPDQPRNEISTKHQRAFELIEAGVPAEEVAVRLGVGQSTLRNYYYHGLRLHRLKQRTAG